LVTGTIARSMMPSFQTARPNCQSMRPNFIGFCVSLIFATLVWRSSALALIAPLQTDGEHFYLSQSDRWQIAVAKLDLAPRFDPTRPDKILHSWTVDAELWLRHISVDKLSTILGVADDLEHTGDTQVFVDGQRVDSVTTSIEYEKAKTEIHRPT